MLEQEQVPTRLRIGFPGVAGVDTDDIRTLFRRRRSSRGPFLLIGRDRGLALDSPPGEQEGSSPVLWPAHAQQRQLWYFHKTSHPGEYVITSVANGLVLDAGWSTKAGRRPEMRPSTEETHQRWKLNPVDDVAFVFESVATGRVLDVPYDAAPTRPVPPILWPRHGGMSQQFLIVTPSTGLGPHRRLLRFDS